MYPVAVVPRPAWTEGRAKGTWKLVMPIDDFKDLFVLKVAEMA